MNDASDLKGVAGIFLTEAKGYVAQLREGISCLEENKSLLLPIEALVRAAHTLKGASAMLGNKTIEYSARVLENLFKKIKEDQKYFDDEAQQLSKSALKEIEDSLEKDFE